MLPHYFVKKYIPLNRLIRQYPIHVNQLPNRSITNWVNNKSDLKVGCDGQYQTKLSNPQIVL